MEVLGDRAWEEVPVVEVNVRCDCDLSRLWAGSRN